ncbi:RNA-binding protein [Schizosaccharomyces pombe]
MAIIVEDSSFITSSQWENVEASPKPPPRKPKIVQPKKKPSKHLSNEDALKKYEMLFGERRKEVELDYMSHIAEEETSLSMIEYDRHFALQTDVKLSKKRKSKLVEMTPKGLKKRKRVQIQEGSVSTNTKKRMDGHVVGSSAPAINNGKGKQLLEMMGWSRGKGLGSENQGMVDPVVAVVKNNKQGLH